MKILHVNYHASGGGAAIAAKRLHLELLRQGVKSRMLVVEAGSDDIPGIIQPRSSCRWFCKAAQRFEHGLLCLDGGSRTLLPRSLNLFRSGLGATIRAEKPDLLHLHWINGGMLSVSELPRFEIPTILAQMIAHIIFW